MKEEESDCLFSPYIYTNRSTNVRRLWTRRSWGFEELKLMETKTWLVYLQRKKKENKVKDIEHKQLNKLWNCRDTLDSYRASRLSYLILSYLILSYLSIYIHISIHTYTHTYIYLYLYLYRYLWLHTKLAQRGSNSTVYLYIVTSSVKTSLSSWHQQRVMRSRLGQRGELVTRECDSSYKI